MRRYYSDAPHPALDELSMRFQHDAEDLQEGYARELAALEESYLTQLCALRSDLDLAIIRSRLLGVLDARLFVPSGEWSEGLLIETEDRRLLYEVRMPMRSDEHALEQSE